MARAMFVNTRVFCNNAVSLSVLGSLLYFITIGFMFTPEFAACLTLNGILTLEYFYFGQADVFALFSGGLVCDIN